MDAKKIGQAILFLRKRAGYTQKDLAERIGISDKAISKWERGQGLPDITYLRKLSILLDTDTDSLLDGDVVHHDSGWQGVVVLDENSYGIGASTLIYDKPLIEFILSYFLLVGIRNIAIACSEEDEAFIRKRTDDGRSYGMGLSFSTSGIGKLHTSHEKNTMIVYGRCFLYGVDQTRFFQKAMINKDRLTLLALPKKSTTVSEQIRMDINKKVVNNYESGEEDLQTLNTQYDYCGIPILFCPPQLIHAILKSGNVGKFLNEYREKHDLHVEMLDRGFVEIEVDSWNDVQEASSFLRIVQQKCGMNVYCLAEVAWRRGMISAEMLKAQGDRYAGTEYGDYILSLYKRVKARQIK